jgi:hypothetical protein
LSETLLTCDDASSGKKEVDADDDVIVGRSSPEISPEVLIFFFLVAGR